MWDLCRGPVFTTRGGPVFDMLMVRRPICTSTATLSHQVYGQVNHASTELGSPLVSLSVSVLFCLGELCLNT